MSKPILKVSDTLTGKTGNAKAIMHGTTLVLHVLDGMAPYRMVVNTATEPAEPLVGTTISSFPQNKKVDLSQVNLPASWKGNYHITAIVMEAKQQEFEYVIALAFTPKAADAEQLRKEFLSNNLKTPYAFQLLLVIKPAPDEAALIAKAA